MTKRISLLVASLCSCVLVADTVTLKNGDVISGSIQRLDPAGVVVQTDYAGELSLKTNILKTLKSDRPVKVVDAQGASNQLYLTPDASGEGWQVTPAPIPAPPKRHSSDLYIGPSWENQLALGVTNRSGNDEAVDAEGSLKFNYRKAPSELNISLSGAYGQTNGTKSSEQFIESVIYRHDITPRMFWFADEDARYDGIKGISVAASASTGPGIYLVRREKLAIDVKGGPGVMYTRHFDDDKGDTSVAAKASGRLIATLTNRLALSHQTDYTTSLEDTQSYTISSETALTAKLDYERGLSLRLAFRDDYDNQPSAGKERNDTRVLLQLVLDF